MLRAKNYNRPSGVGGIAILRQDFIGVIANTTSIHMAFAGAQALELLWVGGALNTASGAIQLDGRVKSYAQNESIGNSGKGKLVYNWGGSAYVLTQADVGLKRVNVFPVPIPIIPEKEVASSGGDPSKWLTIVTLFVEPAPPATVTINATFEAGIRYWNDQSDL